MEVRHPYRHNYAGYPLPEFVFHIGPSPTNQLHIQNDYHSRVKEIKPMLEKGHPRLDSLHGEAVDWDSEAENRGLYGGGKHGNK